MGTMLTPGIRQKLIAVVLGLALASPAAALDRIDLFAIGASGPLRTTLAGASLLAQAKQNGETDTAALMAAARADYAQLLEALYGEGYFGPEISITVDGREAASIPTFEDPARISVIRVLVRPGQRFTFGQADVTPVAPGTDLPGAFRTGQTATTGVLIETAAAAVEGWENAGFPKANILGQDLAVRHTDGQMNAQIFVAPGPQLRFGALDNPGTENIRPGAIARIIGWPAGMLVTPEAQAQVAARLRRTGAFRSVALREAETSNRDGTLDHDLLMVEEAPRRFGLGAEISTEEGLTLGAFWLHRNLTGGAERLRLDGEVSGIGGQTGGIDYDLSARLERPGTFFVDTDLFIELGYTRLDEPDFTSDVFEAGVGLKRIVNDHLTLEGGLGFYSSDVTDATGSGSFRLVTLPGRLTWSTRDDALDATEGHFIDADVMPFLGFADAGSGARITLDGRMYRSLDAGARFVLAARGQLGSIVGPNVGAVPADLRFFSGGGGTVRGQPYQSLGIDVGGDTTGGLSFAALSAELRAHVGDQLGLVGFVDVGFVGETALPGEAGEVQAGAGLGLRYITGLGPIRLDVAVPVTESSGSSLFFYVGIGQAF
ncbi:MAG: BamA/TamA family outer membrane protein [Pseudomonadota bacterium]